MKRLVTLLLLAAAGVHAQTQPQPFIYEHPMWCMSHNDVLKQLKEKYNEVIVWVGKDIQDGSSYAMSANAKENTFTIIKSNGEVACVMAVGTHGAFVGPGSI